MYQQITTDAARLGGVENLLVEVGRAAVERAAPRIAGVWGVAGLAVGSLATFVLVNGVPYLRERRARIQAGDAAADELRAMTEAEPHSNAEDSTTGA